MRRWTFIIIFSGFFILLWYVRVSQFLPLPAARADTWYSSSWPYRMRITINHARVSTVSGANLSDFPILVSITDSDLKNNALANGNDLVFTAGNGATKLNDEIESYSSSTGQLLAWVNIPSVSATSDTPIYLYFGNGAATSSSQNVTGTWNQNYVAVYHFPNGSVLTANDSTANGNNATVLTGDGGTTPTAGEIDGAAVLNGNAHGMVVASSTSLSITGNLTLEAWVNSAVLPSGYNTQNIMYGDNGSDIAYSLNYGNDGAAATDVRIGSNVGGTDYRVSYATTALATGTWNHIVGTWDGTDWNIYVNGVLEATSSSATGPQALTRQVDLGVGGQNGQTFQTTSLDGSLDEARISNVARSPDWIATEYNNISNPNTFETTGSLETMNGLPTVVSFGANPIAIGPGATSTLSWNVVGANSISIAPGLASTSTAVGSIVATTTSTTTYVLTAANGNGTSTASTTVTVDTTPPTIPTNLAAAATLSSAIKLSWTFSTDNIGVAGYDIYRGTSPGTIVYVATSSTGQYTDSGLAPSTTYYYQVDAYDAAGNASAKSSVVNTGTFATGDTIVTVSSTVDVAGAKSFGINIGGADYYDSGQILKNLIGAENPGLQGQIYQSVLPCATTSGVNDCNDGEQFDTWPNNFWAGATYEMILGSAKGRTGTIATSTTGYPYSSTDFTLSAGSPAIGAGDYIIVRKTVNDVFVQATTNSGGAPDPVEGWWITNLTGNATTSVDLVDLASSTSGTQALQINASGTGNALSLTSYFDTLAGHTFVQLNGNYELSFQAKGAGGTNRVNVQVGRNQTFLNQNVTLSTSTWQTYTYEVTANEDGTQTGNAFVTFALNNASMMIDDVSLVKLSGDPSNTTQFTDGMITALKELHPGILRDWTGQLADTLDNSLATPFARKTTHYQISYGPTQIPIGLNDFLQLCQTVGAEPWYVIPTTWDPQDVTNLMEFLGGPATSPYGAKRAALGQVAPWTSVFPEIHLEFGDENWNTIFAGGVITNPSLYAARGDAMFAAAKSSPYYLPSRFQFILGAQYVNSDMAIHIVASSTHEDAIGEGPYFANDVESSTASNIETLFGGLFAEIENDSHSNTGGTQLQNVQAISPVPVVDYEENISTVGGSITQSQLNSFVPSLGAGLALGDHMLMQLRDLGIVDQNVWSLSQFNFLNTYNGVTETAPMWGTVIDMGLTNRKRPQFLAEELANDAIGTSTNVLMTTQSGDNPTWTQSIDYYNTTIPNVISHDIQSYAFSNGNLVLFNLNRSNALRIFLNGAPLPSGNVTVEQLTSANITDNNETTNTVQIATQNNTHFDSTQPITLPPYSMTVYLQNASSSSGGSSGGGSSGGISVATSYGGGAGSGYGVPTPVISPSGAASSSLTGAGATALSMTQVSMVIAGIRSLSLRLLVLANQGRSLTIGSRGIDVWALQVFLSLDDVGPASKRLAMIGPTGYFGLATRAALVEYQASVGIVPASGYFGNITRAYLSALTD